jgi:hypothetical protein
MPLLPKDRPGAKARLAAQPAAAKQPCDCTSPKPASREAIAACPYRGEELRREECTPCAAKGSRVVLKVLSCSMVDECIMGSKRLLTGVKPCGLCKIPTWLEQNYVKQSIV